MNYETDAATFYDLKIKWRHRLVTLMIFLKRLALYFIIK